MSGRDGRRRRNLTRDERDLWTRFTKAIAPLRPPAIGEPELPDEQTPAARPPSKPRHIKPAPAKPAPPPARVPAPAAPQPAPLGRRLKQRIGRGQLSIDARLDLHGLTQSEAHDKLLRFLRRASAGDRKLVLVITGKSGVLRRQVPQWLAMPEFRALVVGLEQAGIRHGGEGALYVRVRRQRQAQR